MRTIVHPKLSAGRIRSGPYESDDGYGLAGAFTIRGPAGTDLAILSSGNELLVDGWEHVSISTKRRCPEWAEMCFVKDLFWTEDETVVQFHPAKKDYINYHPHCLHLWRQQRGFPTPPTELVGPRTTDK